METIKSTIAENLGGAAHAVAGKENQFDINKDVPDLSGKVALITGGSEGIGYATAHTLLKANLAKVFIVSMSEDVVSLSEPEGQPAVRKAGGGSKLYRSQVLMRS